MKRKQEMKENKAKKKKIVSRNIGYAYKVEAYACLN